MAHVAAMPVLRVPELRPPSFAEGASMADKLTAVSSHLEVDVPCQPLEVNMLTGTAVALQVIWPHRRSLSPSAPNGVIGLPIT